MLDVQKTLDLVDLMRRYQAGETAAFQRLYPAVQRRLRIELRSIKLSPTLVEDISQQALLRAHAARQTCVVEGNTRAGILAWYAAIARRVAIDNLRTHMRRAARTDRAASRGITFMANSDELCRTPEELKIRSEDRDAATAVVHDALRHLTPTQREAVELHKLRGLSVQDAAERVGSRAVTLRVRAHRGYKALVRHISSAAPEFARQHRGHALPALEAA